MKQFHLVELSVFVKEALYNIDPLTAAEAIQEELEKYVSTKLNISKEDFKQKGITSEIETMEADEFNPKPLYIAKLTIKKKPENILTALIQDLNKEDLKFLGESLDTRIDEKIQFFMRLDVPTFMENQKFQLVDHGDCIHVKAKIATFPVNKEAATNIIQNIIETAEK